MNLKLINLDDTDDVLFWNNFKIINKKYLDIYNEEKYINLYTSENGKAFIICITEGKNFWLNCFIKIIDIFDSKNNVNSNIIINIIKIFVINSETFHL